MAEVTSLSDNEWCLTEDCRELVKIPQKGTEKDFEPAINRATDRVQAWWRRETGESSLPDASTLDDLLVDATALMAAHLSHFTFAWNFQGNQQGDTTGVASAKREAKDTFEDWVVKQDVTDSEAVSEGEVVDHTVQSGSLIDEF